MWVLLLISLWSSGGSHSEVIGQFTSRDLCVIAEQAMQRSVEKFGDNSAAHSYKCERLPSK